MIGLRKDGRSLKLFPGVGIPWEMENDLLDFDFIGQAGSWPMDLPREGNEWAFDFAGDGDAPVNGYKDYDGYEVTVNGNVWWVVTLTLIESFDGVYQVMLSSVPSVLNEQKGKSIRELVDAEIDYDFEFLTTTGAWDQTIADKMVFPVMTFYNDYEFTLLDPVNTGKLCPWFQILYVLSEALKGIGMTLQNNAVANDDDMYNAIMCTNKAEDLPIPGTIEVADWLPEMTLSQLLNDCQVLFGCDIVVDDTQKLVELRSLDHVLKREAIDITNYVDERVNGKKAPISAVKLSFDVSKDPRMQTSPFDLVGNDVGYFDQVSDFLVYGVQEGDYAFIRQENAYYKGYKEAGVVFLRRYGEAIQSNTVAKENTLELTLNLMPVRKDRYIYLDLSTRLDMPPLTPGDNLVISGEGFEKWISEYSAATVDYFEFISDDMQVYFEEEGEVRSYWGDFFDIISVDHVNHAIELNVGFVESKNVTRVVFRKSLDHYCPMIGSKSNSEGLPGYVAIFRGRQPGISGADVYGEPTYAYASADPYNSQFTKIGTTAIRSTLEDNLLDTVWNNMVKFMRETRTLKLTGRLGDTLLRKLYSTGIARWKGGLLIVSKTSCELRESGIGEQEIEGYRV